MQRLLIFHPDQNPFHVRDLEQITQAEPGFHSVRFDEPGGSAFEAKYSQPGDYTTIRLSHDRKVISISGATDAPLQVVMLLQNGLDGPLRMVDTDYSFDFILKNFHNIDELRTAMLNGLRTASG
jgi:hypothetical protein